LDDKDIVAMAVLKEKVAGERKKNQLVVCLIIQITDLNIFRTIFSIGQLVI